MYNSQKLNATMAAKTNKKHEEKNGTKKFLKLKTVKITAANLTQPAVLLYNISCVFFIVVAFITNVVHLAHKKWQKLLKQITQRRKTTTKVMRTICNKPSKQQ